MFFFLADIEARVAGLTAADWLDSGVLMALLLCMLLGAFRGFSGEIAGLVILGLALLGGMYFHEYLSGHVWQVSDRGAESAISQTVVFACIALAIILVLFLLRRLLRGFIRLVVDQPADAMLGIAVGGARGAVLVILIFTAVSMTSRPDIRNLFVDQSRTGRILAPLITRIQVRAGRVIAPPENRSDPARIEENGKAAKPARPDTVSTNSTPGDS